MALPTAPVNPSEVPKDLPTPAIAKDKKDTKIAEKNKNFVKGKFYEITSEDLMKKPAKEFSKFDDKVKLVIAYVQEELRESGDFENLGSARQGKDGLTETVKELVYNMAQSYITSKSVAHGEDAEILTSLVVNEMVGLGPIEPLWKNPDITEIMVNGADKVRVEIGGKLYTVPGARFRNEEHLYLTCMQILEPLGRPFDTSHSYQDGRLPDGSRVNMTHEVIGNGKHYLTIRRFRAQAFSVKDLVEKGAMTEDLAEFLGNMVYNGLSIVVAGPTGAGKTSLLNALSGCIPEHERVITIEDNIEMTLNPKKDIVALEARKGPQGDKGNVSIRDLVRNSLRMRPDRIIVGEVRDSSAYDMLQAMNTGHDGSMTTVHANDPYGAIDRVVNLISEVGDIDTDRALTLIAGGIDLIVSIDRYEDGSRRVASIAEIPNRVTVHNGSYALEPLILWEYVQTGIDENDMVLGHYEKKNELSPSMIKKKRLDKRDTLPLEEVYRLSSHSEADK
jgi:pilus assembly protein CpaF